ncbi:Hypothetical predicted protein [Pelobates cultripes]|uniref:Uncharacterized protein n=1 Tax=Pelobates cultripes TaxID=61616 RepID=A0AAD1WL61_PELCU|nr:Hypothetical predicted protein [Pelobates cultripes]
MAAVAMVEVWTGDRAAGLFSSHPTDVSSSRTPLSVRTSEDNVIPQGEYVKSSHRTAWTSQALPSTVVSPVIELAVGRRTSSRGLRSGQEASRASPLTSPGSCSGSEEEEAQHPQAVSIAPALEMR